MESVLVRMRGSVRKPLVDRRSPRFLIGRPLKTSCKTGAIALRLIAAALRDRFSDRARAKGDRWAAHFLPLHEPSPHERAVCGRRGRPVTPNTSCVKAKERSFPTLTFRRAMMLTPLPQHSEVARFLSLPTAYGDGSESVCFRQTRTSWIFLTERFAYKLKKPVQYEAEDYSTLELREKAFREELRLGQRLTPHVYRSVVGVKQPARGGFSLWGAGAVVDWVLEMRRLDERQSLARLIEAGEVRREMTERVAEQLTQFYANQPPISLKADDFLAMLNQRIETNYRQIVTHIGDATSLNAAHRAQVEFLSRMNRDFAQRVCDGRIVEAHGDLTPEHVFFDQSPAFIGCTTGPEDMRPTDVADDLATLAMECDRRGAPEFGAQLKDCYIQQSGDSFEDHLFVFYKCYRAHRRAASLLCCRSCSESADTSDDPAQYLRIASEYAETLSRDSST